MTYFPSFFFSKFNLFFLSNLCEFYSSFVLPMLLIGLAELFCSFCINMFSNNVQINLFVFWACHLQIFWSHGFMKFVLNGCDRMVGHAMFFINKETKVCLAGVMPSCTSLMIPRNPHLYIPVSPSLVLCDVMSMCHAHAPLSFSCFVSVCIEHLV